MREIKYDNPNKIYVAVTLRTDETGKSLPLSFEWEDGRRFCVDKVLDVCKAPSLKAGGIGTRYTCMVCKKSIYLFFEDPRWFMERRD